MCDKQKKLISSMSVNINGDVFRLSTNTDCETLTDLMENLIIPVIKVLGYSPQTIEDYFGEV